MKKIIHLLGALLILIIIDRFECKGLKEEFTWTRIDYVWAGSTNLRLQRYQPYRPQNQGRPWDSFVFPGNTDSDNGENFETISSENRSGITYRFEVNLPMGANRWQNKLFITVPRRRVGVPSTLNYVLMNSTERHNVPLIPYPNWRTNQLEPTRDVDGLVSVYRTFIDACDRLWLVDTGLIETPGNSTRYHNGKIVIINLRTDRIIQQYNLKPSDVRPQSTLASVAVDVTSNSCDRAFAYIPDLGGYGIIVYSLLENDSWRVNHNYFYMESLHGDFFIGSQRFQWNDGVFSLALSDVKADGFRVVYFHSMAGVHLFSVSTKILRDRQLATRSNHGSDFKIIANRREGAQTSSSDLHKPSGVLFLGLVNQNALGCYNINKEPKLENFDVVYRHDQKMIYPSDIKIYKDEVIMLSNTMPVQLYSNLNYNEVNFRVWIANVYDAVKDTNCSTKTFWA